MKLVWPSSAIEDLSDIYNHIIKRRPESAERVAVEILKRVEALTETPNLGRRSKMPGIRELVIGRFPYYVPYRVKGKEIHLLRVLHDKRDWPLK